jgi:predicted permease
MESARELYAAIRRLLRAPLFAVLVVTAQAFGVGVTVSAGVLLYALFQAHPIRDISSVVDVQRLRPPANLLSWSEVDYIASHQRVFTDVLPWVHTFEPLVIAGRQPEWIAVESVGDRYFDFVGQQVAIGRTLLPEDNRDGAPSVAVISDRLWRRVFAAERGVIGRTLKLGNQVLTVVGVASSSFHGIGRPNSSPTAIWISLCASRLVRPYLRSVDEQLGSLQLEARLGPSVTVAQARAQMELIADEMDRDSPPDTGGNNQPYAMRRTFRVRPADTVRIGEQDDAIGVPLAALATVAVVTVFLIVAVNLAVLALARANARGHEMAIRVSLGASRARLATADGLDATILALAGAGGGTLVAVALLRRMVAAARYWPGFGKDFEVSAGAAFVALLTGASLICWLVIGLVPALVLRGKRIATVLAMHGSAGGVLSRFAQRVLIIGQIAVSFVLVSVSVVTGRQVALAASQRTGIDLERLAIVEPDYWIRAFGPSPAPPWRVRSASEQFLAQVRRLSGVEDAALSSGLPFGRTTRVRGWVATPDKPFVPGPFPGGYGSVLLVSTPEVFHTLGVRLLRGRFFGAADGEASDPVTVITQSTAVKVFGTSDCVGRRCVVIRQPWPGETSDGLRPLTVVGVVSDIDANQIGYRREGVLFLPFAQNHHVAMTVVARASDPERVLEGMRIAIWKVDPEAAVTFAGTGAAAGGSENLLLSGTARATGLLGLAALVFSMGGLGGILWTLVARRAHEIAVRMALGATRGTIARGVVWDGFKPVAVGIVLGILLSAVTGMGVRPSFVEFVPSIDLEVLGAVSLVISSVAIVTTSIPARRAATANPHDALKEL